MSSPAKNDLLRSLPSVDELLRSSAIQELVAQEGHAATTEALRAVLDRLRAEVRGGHLDADQLALAIDGIADATARELRQSLSFSLQKVINATGVVLHTNLGRAPLAASALRHLSEISAGYSNLEFDLESGDRGKRDSHAQRLLARVLTAENPDDQKQEAIVVNNCAAAVFLALNTLAEGGEVIVSRGELVEIGGSFRVPEIMAKSGAVLREVGTTNRTRIGDYEKAITPSTRLLLRVHRSNFAMVGFTEQPSAQELVDLGRKHRVPVMEDLGNGLLVDLSAAGIHGEYGVNDSLRAGIDVVCVSGDKLLGGPQAGIIAGSSELVRRMRSNPLFRALRVDKLTYATLEATLLAYIRRDYAEIPTLRMIFIAAAELRSRAEALAKALAGHECKAQVIEGESLVGGGTAPTATLPTSLVALSSAKRSAEEIQAALRKQSPPVIARVQDDRLVLDLRTVFAEDETTLLRCVLAACA